MWFSSQTRSRVGELILMAVLATSGSLPAFAVEVHRFDIPEEGAAAAIRDFGVQAHVQILVAGEAVNGKKLHAVAGELSTEDGINALLNGSGLTHQYVGDRSIAVLAASPGTAASTQAQLEGSVGTNTSDEERKKSSPDAFRVAQVDQGKTASDVSVEKKEKEKNKKTEVLEEVVVTGSRIPHPAKEGTQEVKIYTKEQIDQSGQTTVADFMNTLPSVSQATGESGLQSYVGATTVQLRGLPVGTTLVLLNSRRLESSGAQSGQFFDLNSIPLAAVERIEVVSDGSSAIYGSDAIAGVVNIILRRGFDGFEGGIKFGHAAELHETDASLAWGKEWEHGSLTIVGSYQTRSGLSSSDRTLTSTRDFTSFGGQDNNLPLCSPANIYSVDGITPLPGLGTATYAAVPNGYRGTPTIQEFSATAGIQRTCSLLQGSSLIPESRRPAALIEGKYEVASGIEAFTELMYSRVSQYSDSGPQFLFGGSGFGGFTVSASNPYNPFGTTVGINVSVPSIRQTQILDTDFARYLLGLRGSISNAWRWELSMWRSMDSSSNPQRNVNSDNVAIQDALNSINPVVALNPFIDGPMGSQSELQSLFSDALLKYRGVQESMNGFLGGPALALPGGPVELLIGGEYVRDRLSSETVVPYAGITASPEITYTRKSYALFAEASIPIVASGKNSGAGGALALTLAGRHDHYNDFGTVDTPQLGAVWRPLNGLVIRASYSKSFKAPLLVQLNFPRQAFQTQITDPATGQPTLVQYIFGGNPRLQPETGSSKTLGVAYSGDVVPGLSLSATYWNLTEDGAIQALPLQTIVDNENLFPGRVTRGPNGNIVSVDGSYSNFGTIEVSGLDLLASYRRQGRFGEFSTALSASRTIKYTTELIPNSPAIDANSVAQDTSDWAPRWKGTVSVGWKRGALSANAVGRYIGRYQDYDRTNEIGNFWIYDANCRYDIGNTSTRERPWLSGLYVEIGAINLLNKAPQFSNYQGGFVGYDPAEADIRGRFLYTRIGSKW